jgi:hypothetical protein
MTHRVHHSTKSYNSMVYHRARWYDAGLTIFHLPSSHYTKVSTPYTYYHTGQILIVNQHHKAHLNTMFHIYNTNLMYITTSTKHVTHSHAFSSISQQHPIKTFLVHNANPMHFSTSTHQHISYSQYNFMHFSTSFHQHSIILNSTQHNNIYKISKVPQGVEYSLVREVRGLVEESTTKVVQCIAALLICTLH